MANNGIKQAVIVYKVRASDNAPLDLDGNPTVVDGEPTGRKQAIAILSGTENPNPALYDVQFTFAPDSNIAGTPTIALSEDCPTGYIFISPAPPVAIALTLANPTATYNVVSSNPWTVAVPPGVAITPTTGPRGSTSFTLSRDGDGLGPVIFTNTATGQTVSVFVVSTDTAVWILETGAWNMSGFWFNTSIWNY